MLSACHTLPRSPFHPLHLLLCLEVSFQLGTPSVRLLIRSADAVKFKYETLAAERMPWVAPCSCNSLFRQLLLVLVGRRFTKIQLSVSHSYICIFFQTRHAECKNSIF